MYLLLARIPLYALLFAVLFIIFQNLHIDPFFLSILYIALAACFLHGVIRRRYSVFTLNDTHLTVAGGMLFHSVDHVQYRNITSIYVSQNHVERLLGLKKISISPIKGRFSESSASYACIDRKKGVYILIVSAVFADACAEAIRHKLHAL